MRSLKVFAASLVFLSATLLPAQRAGAGAGAGFGGHSSAAVSGAGGHGSQVGIVGGNGRGSYGRGGYGHGNHFHGRRGYGYGAAWYPWYGVYSDYWNGPWDYDDFGPDNLPPDEPPYQPQPASPAVVVMQAPQNGPTTPPPAPKLVEVPLEGPRTPSKPQLPALFVLQNGQQIESDRYVLSDKSVTIDVGRQQRTIPLSDINISETMAANHQRGLDIAFPRDANSLFLSF